MVQKREKLHNVKYQYASSKIFNLAHMNEVGKSDAYIYGRLLLQTI